MLGCLQWVCSFKWLGHFLNKEEDDLLLLVYKFKLINKIAFIFVLLVNILLTKVFLASAVLLIHGTQRLERSVARLFCTWAPQTVVKRIMLWSNYNQVLLVYCRWCYYPNHSEKQDRAHVEFLIHVNSLHWLCRVVGIYCGPLRLLAWEVAKRLNKANVPCDLITGQEREEVDGAKHKAVTVEMADVTSDYSCAVVDEIQVKCSTNWKTYFTSYCLNKYMNLMLCWNSQLEHIKWNTNILLE